MNDQQLLRYARHILLDELGIEGQEKLLAARVLIIGAGGLGSPAALYLATAGVGSITLADDDSVELSNLQRQILHTMASLGRPKAESGRAMLAAFNPEIDVQARVERLDGLALSQAVAQADLVLDCTDNFTTRHATALACSIASRWCRVRRFVSTGRSAFTICATTALPATTVCFQRATTWSKPIAPPWAYSPPLWALSAACRRLRPSSC